jgi:pyruvate formate lyase activating enzyme
MKILGYNEIRKAYFLEAFERDIENMLIISFGKCNYNCPYCKRNGNFKDKNGNIIESKDISLEDLLKVIDQGIQKGFKIRLSGGDPCCFIEESLEIAKYISNKYNQKISIAHNGSSIKLIKNLLPYLDYLALDFKGSSNIKIAKISDTSINEKSIDNILEIIKICEENNILVDLRTVIFGDTSLDDIKIIGNYIKDYKNIFWTLRNYNKVKDCDFLSADIDNIELYCKYIKNTLNINCGYRDKWKNCNFKIFL